MTTVLILLVAVILLTGFAVIAGIGGSFPKADAMCSSFVLGLGILPAVLFLVSLAGFRITALPVLLLGGGAAVLAAVRFRAVTFEPMPRRMNVAAVSGMLVIFFVVGLVAFLSLTWGFESVDGFNIWGLKGKILFLQPLKHNAFFVDPTRSSSHTNYPLGYSLLVSAVYAMLGGVRENAGKLVCVLTYSGFLMMVWVSSRSFLSDGKHWLFTAMVATTPLVIAQGMIGLADVALAMFIMGALYFGWRAIRDSSARDVILAAVMAGSAALTKNEGLAFAAILPVAGCCCRRNRKSLAGLGIYFGILAAFLLPFLLWRSGIPNYNEDYASQLRLGTILGNASRIPIIAFRMFRELWDPRTFGMFWFLFAGTVILQLRRPQLSKVLFPLAVLLLMAGLYFLIYIITPHDLEWHFYTSMQRLLLHLMPAAILIESILWSGSEG